MASKNGCPFVASGPEVFSMPSWPCSLSYVANSGSGVPCPGLHHLVSGAAARNAVDTHTARSVDCHLVIGPLLLFDSKMSRPLKDRSNLPVVKALIYAMYAMFAMTTDS